MGKISFLIPVYRNEGSLKLTFEKITTLFTGVLKEHSYEFVFIDDGSDDHSLDELLSIKQQNTQIKILSLSRNFGQTTACIAGLKEVSGDAVVIMSADLQEPVELIINMVVEWQKGNEIIICQRENREDSLFATWTSKFFYGLIRLANPRMPKGGFDFYLLDRRAIDELNKFEEKNRFFQGDILWLGFGIKFLPYHRQKRTIGKSQWTISKKVKYFIDGVLNTSYIPIRIMSLLGMITSLIGFIYAVLIIYGRLFSKSSPFLGWAPIMVLILIIGGLIMLMLGVIGEYIWRIYDEVRKRPHYIIKNKFL
ncbi:MAG: glycosyltransferase family 2 protein [Bacteroidota bacterium]